ncbi:DUF362 domain-containing protein [bacterium D16-76]|nr:DUF362 domain-containing protein [bacterium D16-76]
MKSKKLVSTLLAIVLLCTTCFAAMGAARPADVNGRAAGGFSDVPDGTWYTEAVNWCRENGIMSGTGNNNFAPGSTMSRAMLAAVLYRSAGSPAVDGLADFSDVPANAYYNSAAKWASDNGYIGGYGNRVFGSDDPVTREQIVSILWRYEGRPVASAPDFADETAISSFAVAAVDWARANSIVSGVGNNRFDPKGTATRAQVAVVLHNYLTKETPSTPTPSPDPSPEPSDGSVVYFTDDISPEGMLAIYNALQWSPTGKVAVKLSTGEPPASNYLRPELIKDVVDEVQGTIVECNTAYGGSRAQTAMHYQVAKDHGFTDIADFQILDEDGSMTLPVTGGTRLTENYVGAAFADYDSYLVLSHFKGHAMAGFGGAIKNISIGLGSQEGKCVIHTAGNSHTSPWGGDQTGFTESMAEAGKAVSDYLGSGERIVYINVLNNISIDCDCDGNPAAPDIHDIGILASTDPVAIDQASIDLAFAAEGSESLQNRVNGRNGLHTLEHAEEIGLGSREYRLVNIND